MEFVVGLPRTQKGQDSIWVIVDRLTKAAHFIPVRTNYGGEKLAKLYVENIVKFVVILAIVALHSPLSRRVVR